MGLPQHRRLAFALVAALGSALVFARITEDYLTNDPLARWDVSVAAWFADHQSTAGADAFRGITNLGSPLVCLVIATIACVVLTVVGTSPMQRCCQSFLAGPSS